MSEIEKIDKNMANEMKEDGIDWYSAKGNFMDVRGLAFFQQDKLYRRMPQDKFELFEKVNPNLNSLGMDPAGGQVRFRTDSMKIYVKAEIGYAHDMPNMTAIGQCGFDVYARYDNEANYKFFGSSGYNIKETTYISLLTDKLQGGMKDIIVNMPLYVPLVSLEIGIEEGSKIEKGKALEGNPFVFYGTSITQGGCVSRPGTCYPNIISRRFNHEVYNFGFSANGLGEYEMAELLRDLPKLDFICLDYEANAGTNGLLEKSLKHFIEIIREKQSAPILVISRIPYTNDFYEEKYKEIRNRCRKFQKETVEKFNQDGDKKVFFLDGYTLFGSGWEDYTVDFIHPTDAGHILMADGIEKKMIEIFRS